MRLAVLSAVMLLVAACGSAGSTGAPMTPGPTESSTASAGASPGASSLPAPGGGSPAANGLLSGSVPPASTAAWTGLNLGRLTDGPLRASSVVAWSGGYLALGQSDGSSTLPAWISRDGRTWMKLPTDTFGPASTAEAAPCADGIVVAIQSATGETTIWHSADGVTWASVPWPQMGLARQHSLAGGTTGAIGILAATPPRLAFSSDGAIWQTVPLPGSSGSGVREVAAFAGGFVAVGAGGTDTFGTPTGSPVAWWSADGTHWTPAAVQADQSGAFTSVEAGSHGLVAFSHSGGAPGLTSFWTSSDGRTWRLSDADPLGVLGEGEGMGSAAGTIVGDGTRLIGFGSRGPDQATEFWVSFDATHWTRLAMTGDTATALAGTAAPFLLRDGVLFSGEQGSWFGTPTVTTASTSAPPLASEPAVPALTVDHPKMTVSPSTRLKDGQTVEVRVTGFGVGGKVWLSECASAAAATDLGCGVDLAAQPFIVTDENRAGWAEFIVRAKAPGRAPSFGPASACADQCVVVATLGAGGSYVVAPITFAVP